MSRGIQEAFTKPTKRSVFTILGGIVGVITIITATIQAVEWIDDYFVDKDEAFVVLERVTRSTNKNLQTINSNIILLGNAFYDQRISEIESLINQVEHIENKNPTEIQFLESLKRDRLELIRQQEILQKTKVDPIGN